MVNSTICTRNIQLGVKICTDYLQSLGDFSHRLHIYGYPSVVFGRNYRILPVKIC